MSEEFSEWLAGVREMAQAQAIRPGYFRRAYGPLAGSDWLRRIGPEDMAAFAHLGNQAAGYGRVGGRVRAATAKRDSKGRFTSVR